MPTTRRQIIGLAGAALMAGLTAGMSATASGGAGSYPSTASVLATAGKCAEEHSDPLG